MNCAIHTDTPAVAYCRTCGKALCENCKRDVMGAIYCEPCIAARLQGAQATPGAPTVIPVAVVQGSPSPGLAALLGMIPGVGAMYNGQFIKAFIHVVIFAMLIVAQSYVYGPAHALFGLLTGFFWFYMIFDAYKTAKARQLGQPAPDPLGLDKLFGIQEDHPPVATTSGTQPVPGQPAAQPGLVDRAPTGAVILVALGVFFLLGNLGLLHINRLWPLLLIGFGLWIAYKRTTERY